MKIGSDSPISLEDHPRDQAHEPAVEVHVHALVQPPRRADVAGGEVPVGVAVEGVCHQNRHGCTISPNECRRERENRREHVAADDRRAAGEVAEGDGANDALGLADDVVVHHHRVGRGALADRLQLAAGVAAGAAEVALLVDDQQVAQRLLGEREELVVGDLLGALLGDEHRVEVGPQRVVLADLGEQLGAEVGLVEGGDDDVDGAVLLTVGGHLGGPLGGLDDGVLVTGDDVVPVPAAVRERRQRQVEVEGRPAGGVPSTVAASTRCERPLAIDL